MNQRSPLSLVALLLAPLASCHIHIDVDRDEPLGFDSIEQSVPIVLGEVEAEDGSTTTYSLQGQTTRSDDAPGTVYLTITTNDTQPVPFLGLDVGSIDVDAATALSVDPWQGVLVNEAEAGQPASEAGIQPGDVLLGVGDVRFGSFGEFVDYVKYEVEPGEDLRVEISRATDDGPRVTKEIDLTVGSRDQQESESTTEAMRADPSLFERAGLTVVTVPAERAAEIWGAARPTSLVTSVVTGSSAYKEGVRAGDRILAAEGVPVEAVEDVAELLRILDDGDRMKLELDGPLGPLAANVKVEDDVLEQSDVHIPVLYDREVRPHRSHTSVLDFIFQFGFNRHTKYWASRTRDVRKTTSLSILPLGMFEFKRTPTKKTNRIFWLIRWSSER
ncbi:MAG: PDZ domain-containing protein [Planctomycetota bacterium]